MFAHSPPFIISTIMVSMCTLSLSLCHTSSSSARLPVSKLVVHFSTRTCHLNSYKLPTLPYLSWLNVEIGGWGGGGKLLNMMRLRAARGGRCRRRMCPSIPRIAHIIGHLFFSRSQLVNSSCGEVAINT